MTRYITLAALIERDRRNRRLARVAALAEALSVRKNDSNYIDALEAKVARLEADLGKQDRHIEALEADAVTYRRIMGDD